MRLNLKTILHSLLLCVAFHGSLVSADLNDEEVLYSTAYFPPFHLKNDQGKVIGIHAALAEAVYARAGIKLLQVQYPYVRTKQFVREGKMGMMQYGDHGIEKENSQYLFPIPYRVVRIRLYTINPALQVSTDPTTYKGHSFIVVRGWPLGHYSEVLAANNPDLQYFEEADNINNGVRMFFGKRADYLVMFERPFVLAMKKNNFTSEHLKAVTLIEMKGYSFAIPKTYRYADELYQRIKSTYEAMVKEGLIDTSEIMLRDDNPLNYL